MLLEVYPEHARLYESHSCSRLSIYESFLTELGAKKIKHSGRTLYDHLKGTYDILRERKCPENVCVAGLFHSIYGTQYFQHACLYISDRPLLQQMIGMEAEQLVYEFCTTARKSLGSKELMEIAKANHLEQHFEHCWPWLEAALETFAFKHDGEVWPTHRKEHVLEMIVKQKAYFFPGKKCAIVTQIHESPTGLKTHTTWLAGGEPNESLHEIKNLMVIVEEFGRKRGCHRQVGNGRPGWLRVFEGYEAHGIRKTKSL